jgi:hypothetical protein
VRAEYSESGEKSGIFQLTTVASSTSAIQAVMELSD